MSAKSEALQGLIDAVRAENKNESSYRTVLPFEGTFDKPRPEFDRLVDFLSHTDAIDYLAASDPEEGK